MNGEFRSKPTISAPGWRQPRPQNAGGGHRPGKSESAGGGPSTLLLSGAPTDRAAGPPRGVFRASGGGAPYGMVPTISHSSHRGGRRLGVCAAPTAPFKRRPCRYAPPSFDRADIRADRQPGASAVKEPPAHPRSPPGPANAENCSPGRCRDRSTPKSHMSGVPPKTPAVSRTPTLGVLSLIPKAAPHRFTGRGWKHRPSGAPSAGDPHPKMPILVLKAHASAVEPSLPLPAATAPRSGSKARVGSARCGRGLVRGSFSLGPGRAGTVAIVKADATSASLLSAVLLIVGRLPGGAPLKRSPALLPSVSRPVAGLRSATPLAPSPLILGRSAPVRCLSRARSSTALIVETTVRACPLWGQRHPEPAGGTVCRSEPPLPRSPSVGSGSGPAAPPPGGAVPVAAADHSYVASHALDVLRWLCNALAEPCGNCVKHGPCLTAPIV